MTQWLRGTRRGSLAPLSLAALLGLTGCQSGADAPPQISSSSVSQSADDSVNSGGVESATPVEPSWANTASPAPVEFCKVPDGQPEELRGLPRGVVVDGVTARGSLGFPFIPGRFPVTGQANLILAMVAFEDAPAFSDTALEYLGPQVERIEQWADFFSQGTFRYSFQIVEDWIEIPMRSTEVPADDETIARLVLERFPDTIDYESVDGTFVLWAPGIDGGDRHDFGVRVGSNEGGFVLGEKRPGLFWAPSEWHVEDTNGALTIQLKRDYTWAHLIHEMQHEQGLNTHAPGNGWPTGLGQNQYPGPTQFSAALSTWETFLLGWIRDDQVHCIDPEALDDPEQFVLTPVEVYGGERRMGVIPLSNSDVVVIESRRPIGWTENWAQSDRGLLVYTVNPEIQEIDDHSSGDCGNDPTYPKWAYYLYPDGQQVPTPHCGNFSIALVNEGETLTYKGLKISLEYSADEADYVSVGVDG